MPKASMEITMLKNEKLEQIKKLWNRTKRNQKWEEIQWESFVRSGQGIDQEVTDDKLGYYLRKLGVFFWSVGIPEIEVLEDFHWDTALLDWLHVWYSLPEAWDDPFFVNERAGTICIPHFNQEGFRLLFTHPYSVTLGLEATK
jgi:hypothetical protein